MFWQAFVEKKKNDKKNWEFFVKQEVSVTGTET